MGEMIERVARATFKCRPYGDEDSERGIPSWETMDEEWRDVHRTLARAAIEAMREPTDLMGNGLPTDYRPGSHSATQIWQSMIDAALAKATP